MANIAELDDRIAKCNKILEENPNSQIFAALAEAYRKKGEVDKAFRTCQNGLRIHPDYGAGHVVMAKINLDKGMYDWAEMEALRGIELEGSSHAADLLLAEIYIYKGEFARATRLLNKLNIADPQNQNVKKLMDIAAKLPLESAARIENAAKQEPASVSDKTIRPKPVETISMSRLLDILSVIAGVDGVLLINRDGLVAEARWDENVPHDLYGAVVRNIESTIQSQIEIARFGKYENVLLEAGDLIISFLPLGESLLLIKANRHINLGTLRLKLTSLLGRLAVDTI